MAGFDRYKNILQLFLETQSSWTVAEISLALETSASNVYRTVRELVSAGYLESVAESRYQLGPIFLEFEHRLRQTDPLVRSGGIFLITLVEQASIPCCAVLARLYGQKVMCVADARSPRFDGETSYQRGRPMPILRGATSKAILAGLSARKRERLLGKIADSGEKVPGDLQAELDAVRKSQFVVTRGEVDSGLVGIAVPLELKEMGVVASLSFVVKEADAAPTILKRMEELLRSHASLIENFVQNTQGIE